MIMNIIVIHIIIVRNDIVIFTISSSISISITIAIITTTIIMAIKNPTTASLPFILCLSQSPVLLDTVISTRASFTTFFSP